MATKYDRMSMKDLKKIAKSIGFEPVHSDGTPFSKDVLADSIHQFDGAGLLKKTVNKKTGGAVAAKRMSSGGKMKVAGMRQGRLY